ncbi:MAG: glycosyltransferase family 2 protein [Acidobacteria bacterium]|nr:glycosyltransferase family 2 protein [Acidobacteriota bacterium]
MTSSKNPVVDAVICNFNQGRWLPISLERLLHQSFRLRCIHVVDNASTDDSLQVVRNATSRSPVEMKIHRMEVNLGGAGGFAFGTEAAMKDNPDFLMLLDGDAFLHEHTVEKLVRCALERKEVAALGPKIYLARTSGKTWGEISSGRVIQEIGGMLDWERADFLLQHNKRDENTIAELKGIFPVDYVAACACLVRGEAIARCGTMDPSYFLYWDDINWCTRMRAAGYRIEVFADALAWHVGGGRVRISLKPTYYYWRNKIRFFGAHREWKPEVPALDNALFYGLRAVFTCRLFGQDTTADIIEKSLEDGWIDCREPLDIREDALKIQPVGRRVEPKRNNDGLRWIEGLEHVLEIPENVADLDPERTVLSDRYGKEMRLSDARQAVEQFNHWYPERLALLRRLPGAWI